MGPAHFAEDGMHTAIPILVPALIKEFSLSYFIAGLLGFSFRGTAAIANPIIAWRSEQSTNRRLLLIVGLVIYVASLSLFTVAPNYMWILILTAIAGACSAVYHPQALTLLRETTGKPMSSIVGIHGTIGGVGVVASPIIISYLTIHFGWRVAIPILFVPIVAISIPLVWIYFKEPKAAPPTKFSFQLFGGKMYLALLGYQSLMAVALSGLRFFLPAYLMTIRELTFTTSGTIFSIMSVATLVGFPLGGFLASRFNRKALIVTIPIVFSVFYGLFLSIETHMAIWVTCLFIARLASSTVHPILVTALGDTPSIPLATAISMLHAATAAISAFAPLVMGAVADYAGLNLAMMILIIPAIIAVILSVTLISSSFVHGNKLEE